MLISLLIAFLLIFLLAWRKPGLRREMLAAAVLGLPLLFLSTLGSEQFATGNIREGISVLVEQTLFVLVASSLVAAGYHLVLHRLLTPVVHPDRSKLGWLLLGPIIALLLLFIFHQSSLFSFGIALVVDLILVLFIQKSLLWDMLASAGGLGLLYLLLYTVIGRFLGGNGQSLPGLHLSGLELFGQPLENLGLVVLYGALWGPLYSALREPVPTSQPFAARHVRPKQFLITIGILVIVGGFLWLSQQFMRTPRVLAATPSNGQQLANLVTPISIQFDRPFDRSVINVTLTPTVTGELSFDDSYLQRSFVRRVIFTPSVHLQPDTQYIVTVSHLNNVLGSNEQEYQYAFHTPALPTVASASVKPNQTEVGICQPITVNLDQPAGGLANFSFAFTPSTSFTTETASDKKSYMLKPKDCLAQSTPYTLTVLRQVTIYSADGTLISQEDPAKLYDLSFVTKGAPGIASFTPQGEGLLTTTKDITIHFDQAMAQADPATYLEIKPALTGSWRWQDAKTLIYTINENLAFAQTYAVRIKQGLPDQQKGFLSVDANFSFTTIGPVQVSGLSPYRGSTGVNVSAPIKISFDQSVDHASAESRFALAPTTNGSFSWQGNTLIYSAPLDKDTHYQITMSSGVHSLIGQDLQNTVSSGFDTEESTTLLNVAEYYQRHPLSCEAASLKMALSYRGFSVSEDTLLDQIGADPTARQGNIWADPNQTFVGDVNGHQNTTGYGVHAAPIARVANLYRSAQAFSGWGITNITDALAQGNPVIFWGVAGSAKADSWTTPSGSQVNAWVGEHARVIVGFTGSASNPTHFIINDPIFGRLRWTPGQLKANGGTFGNMGVVIF